MDESSVRECITNLKIKNREGYDRIPQRILKEGLEVLIKKKKLLLVTFIRMRETVTEMATGCLRMVKIDIFVLR